MEKLSGVMSSDQFMMKNIINSGSGVGIPTAAQQKLSPLGADAIHHSHGK